jgi:hypothetical protein
MGILGEQWTPSGAPHVLTDSEGRTVTLTVYSYGITLSDAGGTTQLAHVEAVEGEPDAIVLAGRKFRVAPA